MRTVHEISVGDTASMTREVTETDLVLFAAACGDTNPIHFDQAYAEGTFFKGRIAHGMLCAGFISAVIAGQLPGLGTVYVTQSLKFRAPVRIGDRITAEVEALEVDTERNRVRLRTLCRNQDGTVVVDGEALVMPPKRKIAPEALRAMEERKKALEESLWNAREAFMSRRLEARQAVMDALEEGDEA